jgi:biopolymer transport protein ExbD
MARTFRRQRTGQPIAELNVTNLIDLGFMLLIIFMITAPLIKPEQTIPVNLPSESKSPQAKPDPTTKFETVTVKADGTYLLGTQALSLAQLSREFANFALQPKPPVFRLRMDAKSTAQQYVAVLAEMEKHHLSRISIDTQIQN